MRKNWKNKLRVTFAKLLKSPPLVEVGRGPSGNQPFFAAASVFARGSHWVGLRPGEPITLSTGQRPDDDTHERDAREIMSFFTIRRPPLEGVGGGLQELFNFFTKAKLIIILALLLTSITISCRENHDHAAEAAAGIEYTCPMHPQIVQDKPGDCPVCGMTLVAKSQANTPVVATSTDLNYLLQPANQTVISDIKTVQPVQKQVQNVIRMSGVVTYDTRQQYIVPARFGGRIEKLYVQFNYQPVRKGQKLYDIYSPELVTAQKELLYLLQNDPNNTDLISGAKRKLQLLGATENQINQLIRTGQETYTFSVFSPYSGYVLDPSVTAAPTSAPSATPVTGGDNMGGMGGATGTSGAMGAGNSAVSSATVGNFAFREGMYVTTGQALLKVIDASQVWAQFNVASSQAGQLTKGTPVTITFNQLPGDTVASKVSLVEPIYEAGENFARARVLLPAQNKLTLIGQLITGTATYQTGTALWVPKEAVLDMGTQSVAFIKVNEVFKPILVQAGQRANGQVEVLAGLNARDVIAANAQFLVDSESFIRVADNNR